jgi:tetratricopeptide (TPR) repeat protein
MASRTREALRHAVDFEQELRAANALYSKGGEEGERALRKMDEGQAWPEILASWKWVSEHYAENEKAARLCSSYPFVGELLVYLRLPPKDRIRWCEAGAAAARRIKDQHAEAAHLHKLAMAYLDLGEFRKAIPWLKHAVAINRKIRKPAYAAGDLGGLGLAYAGLEDHRRAISYYNKALAIYRATDNEDARWGEGIYLSNLAESIRALGDPLKAISLHQQALAINRQNKDVHSEAYALCNLGKAYADLGQHEHAQRSFEQSLDIARRFRVRQSEAYALFESGRSYWAMGRREEAIDAAKEALTIFEDIEDFYVLRTRKQLAKWQSEPRKATA